MSELQDALDSLVDTNEEWDPIIKAARRVANASVLAGGGDQWIMDWEGELIHPTDLPDGRYLVISIDPPEET